MARIQLLDVQCVHCKGLFPAPFSFGDTDSISAIDFEGSVDRCPTCGQQTPINRDNLLMLDADGNVLKAKPSLRGAKTTRH